MNKNKRISRKPQPREAGWSLDRDPVTADLLRQQLGPDAVRRTLRRRLAELIHRGQLCIFQPASAGKAHRRVGDGRLGALA